MSSWKWRNRLCGPCEVYHENCGASLLQTGENWGLCNSLKDLLKEEMSTHSSILAGERIDGQRLMGYNLWGRKESDTTERLSMRTCSSLAVCQQDRHLITLWEVSSFFGRNDAKAETPVPWPLHAKSWLIGKDFDAGRDCGQEEKGTTEDEMAGWHHWLDKREFEWTPRVGDGQRGLACCDSWGRKESDTTERLNWCHNHLCNPVPSTLLVI